MNRLNERIAKEALWLSCIDPLIKADEETVSKSLINSIKELIIEIEKYSDDQQRDDRGRWTDAGGGSSGGSSGSGSRLSEVSSKPITAITEQAIEKVPYINIDGFTNEQCKFIQEQHKELLQYARDNNSGNEVAFVFRNDLTDRNEVKGSADRLDLGKALVGKGTGLVVMHNHPRNSSYSTTDIDLFAGNNAIKTLTIVKNNGKVEILTKGANFDLSVFQKEYNRLYKKIVVSNTKGEKDKFVKTLLSKTKSGVIWNVG